jgi:hypothetical protein
MQQTLQPYATAGVVLVGASLVAVTPVAAPSPDLSGIDSATVRLTSAWDDVFNDASDNLTQLTQNFGLAPFVGLQQAIVNQADFAQQVLDDPSNITDVTEQMQDNLKAVVTGLFGFGADDDTMDTVIDHTLSGDGTPIGLTTLFGLLPQFVPSDLGDPDDIQEILNFLASPASGILIGSLGPFISPFVALADGIDAGDDPSDIAAHAVGAFFNGTTLDLDGLIPAIEDADILPEDMDFDHLSLALGGLLSTGNVNIGDYGVQPDFDGDDDAISVTATGGSILNSLGLDLSGVPLVNSIDIDGDAVGPLGALIGASETIGVLLGDGWDESGGKDNPHGPAIPPLTQLEAPHMPDDPSSAEALSSQFGDTVDLSGGDDTLADLMSNFF